MVESTFHETTFKIDVRHISYDYENYSSRNLSFSKNEKNYVILYSM